MDNAGGFNRIKWHFGGKIDQNAVNGMGIKLQMVENNKNMDWK